MKTIKTNDILDKLHARHPNWDRAKLKKVVERGCFFITKALAREEDVRIGNQNITVTMHTFRKFDVDEKGK